MKINYLSITSLVIVGGLLSMKYIDKGEYETFNSARFHQLQSSGPAAGNAGAPGENNCTGCHAGNVQAGADFNILTWDGNGTEYALGQTYTMQLSMQDAANKNGFQLVPLKASNNTAVGTLTATDATKTQVLNGAAGKKYLGHKAAGNTSSTWTFEWTAPTTNEGNVIFYVATNKTNGNGQTSGDVVRLSQHVFTAPQSGASLTEYQQIQNSLKISLNAEWATLDIAFSVNQKEELYLNIVNLQGQSVVAKSLGSSYPGENEKSVKLPNTLSSGIYVVNFFIGNKAYSEKIRID